MSHQPVLLEEVLRVFKDLEVKHFIDGTLGAGGHSAAILEEHSEMKQLIGIDRDPTARALAEARLKDFKEKVLVAATTFDRVHEILIEEGIAQIDGGLLDLGVSSMQLDVRERGFSFRGEDAVLDMRMDQKSSLTAEVIVNTYSESELQRIFRDYGEEPKWRAAARALVGARRKARIRTVADLSTALKGSVAYPKKNHPLTLVFQGLRIAVNDELGMVERALPAFLKALRPGGRLAVITFHSLEDRIVKQLFKEWASSTVPDRPGLEFARAEELKKEKEVNILTPKPILPSAEEQKKNKRSRSAKLRVVEKR